MLPLLKDIYLQPGRTPWVDVAVPQSVLDDDGFLGTGQGDVNPLGPQVVS